MLESFKFHHIGVAVKKISSTAAIYVDAGYKQLETIFDPEQNVNICWLTKEGMPVVELLEPVDETSPVNKTLEKNGVAPYHTCYVVDNIEETIAQLRRMKYVIVSKPVEACAIHKCKVAFLYNKNIGLIELVEAPANI
ncbi:MAG: VOC family protein [Paludibacteraceae bacterium]|nr:VOC family protein [Paludibacteraceae bacterium]